MPLANPNHPRSTRGGGGSPGRIPVRAVVARLALAGLLLAALAGGCTEWDAYWQEDNITGPPPDDGNTGPAPVVAISFPPDSHRVASAGTLVLNATTTSSVPGDSVRVTWRSSLDNILGEGHELWKTDLAPGNHEIWAIATNREELSDSVSVTVEVLAEPTYTYCQDVQRSLFDECFCSFCHWPDSAPGQESGLDLRSYSSFIQGGRSTRSFPFLNIVYPCRPESSLVYNKVSQEFPWVGTSMPPPDFPPFPWLPERREKLRVWILEGAPPDDPRDCQ